MWAWVLFLGVSGVLAFAVMVGKVVSIQVERVHFFSISVGDAVDGEY